jgi:hypothetical protein
LPNVDSLFKKKIHVKAFLESFQVANPPIFRAALARPCIVPLLLLENAGAPKRGLADNASKRRARRKLRLAKTVADDGAISRNQGAT